MKNSTDLPRKRALILAGGGMKVAFQAGVLQVWLDEAKLPFDLADGCSGGCLNLIMYCQGMSGTEIADNWRNHNPIHSLDMNWQQYLKLFHAASLFELNRFRKNIISDWKLDFNRIRAYKKEATFNAYNFSRHELATWTPEEMNEDRLISCISLPMWFPPVVMEGNTYIDSVFITDANLEEAIRRGADELWVIWTVSQVDEWHDGFVNNYFQIIETSANGHFRRMLKRIEQNNTAIEEDNAGEFGRIITVKLLESEVQMHYLINFSKDRVTEAVNAGVQAAREWCRKENIPLKIAQSAAPTEVHEAQTALQFTEVMKGFVSFGELDYDISYRQGRQAGKNLLLHLQIEIQGVNRFVTHPDHLANVSGYVEGSALGGRLSVEKGWFNLFVDEGDPLCKYMRYRLFLIGTDDALITLVGYKEIKDDPGIDIWMDTTTLYTQLLAGHVLPTEEAPKVMASGILRNHLTDFLKLLTTFRIEGPTLADRSAALARFGRLFMGKLWDVYAREVLT